MGKYQAQYEVCDTCGYLRAHDPYWLEEAYTRAIANADTGLVMRNITLANKISRVLFWLTDGKGQDRYLDAAGGYGMLTRMMRDIGFDFYWADKYCENLVAPGFEYSKKLGGCSVVTAIEVLEHVMDPAAFIKEILDVSQATTLIFTTELYQGAPPKPHDWWYYAFSTGQHIGFFQHRTLQKLADDLGLKFVTANGIHIFSNSLNNQFLLNFITNRYVSIFMPFLIRKKLGSKVMTDHEVMMRKLGRSKRIENHENSL
ncbi:MAG TPA: class I SAM-dependent methyltransferase [Methylotenera sp.]|nr:class I SAM-dependent methyltransferase [Methylotenera sp.]